MRPSPWGSIFLCLGSLLAIACQERHFSNPLDPDADQQRYELAATLSLAGIVPVDLAFSGDALWACDVSGRVVACNYNSGQPVRELATDAAAEGVAYDGGNLWLTLRGATTLRWIGMITGTVLRDVRLTHGDLGGLDWANDRLYVADRLTNSVLVLDDETGAVERMVPHPGVSLDGVAFDGQDIWTVDGVQAMLYRIDPAGGNVLAYPAPDRTPSGLCAAAGFIWLADRSGRVFKLRFP